MATDADAQAWIDDVVADGGTVRNETAIDNLVIKLKNDGVWAKLDHLWLRKYSGSQIAALKALKSLQDSTATGATFNDDEGFIGDGVDDFIATNGRFGLTNFSQNSAHYGVKYKTGDGLEGEETTGRKGCSILETGGFLRYRVNGNLNSFLSDTPDGFLIAVRENSTESKLYKNGSLIDTQSDTSATPNGGDFASLALNVNDFSVSASNTDDYVGGTEEAVSIGGALTATDVSNLNTAINDFYTEVETVSTFKNVSPADGATGVSTTPTLEINNPDNFTDLNYRVATSSNVDADVIRDIFNQANTASVTEALSASTQYHWNAREFTPGGQTTSFLLQETFTASDEWDDWVETDLAGTNTLSVTGGEGIITSDASSQVGVAYDATWGDVDINLTARFSDVTSSQQPTIHFRVQGTTWTGNFIPSYYLYFLGNELRIGRIDSDGNPQDFAGQSVTFSRTVDTNYDIRILVEDYRIRVAVWASSGSQNGWQFDYIDSVNRFLTGGFAIKNVSDAGGATTITVDNIEVEGAEFISETQSVDSVSVSPTNATGDAGSTVLIEGEILTSGGLSNAGTWSKVSGDADITIGSVSGNDLNASISETASDGDTATFELVADEDGTKSAQATVTAEVSANITGSRAGDEAALEAISASLNLDGQLTGWADSGMSLSNTIDGITTATIGSELRVTRIDLFQKSIVSTNGLPSLIQNLTEMTYFNVMFNEISGPLPQFILPKCVYLYLNHSFNVQDPNVELHDKAEGTAGGGRDVHNGKNDTGAKNKFTGNLYVDCPVIEYLACSWTNISTISVDQLFSNSTFKGLWIGDNVNLSNNNYTVPSSIGNMTSLTHLTISTGNSSNENIWGGELPSVMSNLTLLHSLRLSKNDFTGAFPDLSNCPDFQTCGAFFTTFTSGFPSYLWDGTTGQINSFSLSWNGNNYTDATYPTGFTNKLRSINAIQCNLSGSIPTLNTGVTVTDFSYNPNTTGAPENGRFLFRIRNLRWRDCSISGTLIELDWYNFYRQRDSHPLSGFSGFQIANNNYSSSDLNADLNGGQFPWEIEKKGRFWYFENKYRNGNGDCNILTNVDPNFTKQDYLNAGFSQSTLDAWGGATGYEFMQNMLNDIYLDGSTGPGNGYNTYAIGGQTP